MFEINVDMDKCIGCGECVDICPENCLKLVPLEEIDLSSEHIESARESAPTAWRLGLGAGA